MGVMGLGEGEMDEVKLNPVPGDEQACFITLTSPEVAQRVLRGQYWLGGREVEVAMATGPKKRVRDVPPPPLV